MGSSGGRGTLRTQAGGVMTHGWCGGSYVLAQGLLEQLFPNQASTYFSGLNQAALAIARCLDSQLPGALAELGLDLGLDREGGNHGCWKLTNGRTVSCSGWWTDRPKSGWQLSYWIIVPIWQMLRQSLFI